MYLMVAGTTAMTRLLNVGDGQVNYG
jgi:hypothetical protein